MIETVTSPEVCRALWEEVSPHRRAWDEWGIMNAFHDPDQFELQFRVLREGDSPVGLLPLVRDTRDGSFELFGGCYADNRLLWVRTQDFPQFFEDLPEPTVFFDLNGDQVAELLAAHPQYEPNFVEQDRRWFLVPSEFGWDFTNHIQTFSTDKRKGFLYDLRKVRERNLDIRWSDDDESELFIRLINERFGPESDYNTDSGKAEIRRVATALREGGWLRTVTIAVDGTKQAVGMSLLYGNELIAMYSTSNKEIKNLGKLLNVEIIQEGGRLRVDEVNYMTGMSWKEAWDMKNEPCRTMRKPPKAPETAAA